MRPHLFFAFSLAIVATNPTAFAQVPPPGPPPPPAYGYGAPMAPPAPARPHFGSAGSVAIESDANLGLTGETTGGAGDAPSTSGWTLTLAPAFDYFVIPHLSIGGILEYVHAEAGDATALGTTSTSTNTFGIGPRVGYDIPITDWISVWPKLGLLFDAFSVSGGESGTKWTLTLYAPFLYHLATHFFLGLGPILSADLAANASPPGGTSAPAPKVTTYGLAFTVGGWFTP